MLANEAAALARQLMDEHGLTDWTFTWLQGRHTSGRCYGRTKRIGVSRRYATINDVRFVRNTILHEIAHALAPAKSKHDEAWRDIFIRIGGDGERTRSREAITPPARYRGTCPGCNSTCERDAVPKSAACARCCRALNGGKYDDRFKLIWKRND